jgi:nucleoside 2-deoxyribosyltransferase
MANDSNMNAEIERIYLAGPLFSPLERERNLLFARRFRDLGYTVFLPQEIDAADGSGGLNFEKIYTECRAGVDLAGLVIALVDGPDVDSGVAWELGYAAARGVPIICLRTDFRKSEGHGVNIMIDYGATKMIYATKYKATVANTIEILLNAVDEFRIQKNEVE